MDTSEKSPVDEIVPDTVIPHGNLPPLRYREMPKPILLRRMVGPSIILAGLSLGSGEFILWPYITYQSQFIFFWACLLGVTTQYFINMEVTRWTLATGESAITGFARLSRHWVWIFLVANTIPYVIPAWATGAAELFIWLVWTPETVLLADGSSQIISAGTPYLATLAILGMVGCGILLTTGPVVYKTIEATQFILVLLALILVLVVGVLVIRPDAVATLVQQTATFGAPTFIPLGSDFPNLDEVLVLGALAFAGCGGTLNLGQSNYIKDKGFGMGAHVGRITSPISGQEEAVSEIGYHFPHTPENMTRWNTWWTRASREQFISFFLTCIFCLVVLTLISYSLFYDSAGVLREGMGEYGKGLAFIYAEAEQLRATVGAAGPLLFLVMGIVILFTTELAVLDATSRISSDIVKVNWLMNHKWWTESRLYFAFLWGEIAVGSLVLLIGVEQFQASTLGLFKMTASLNGGIMCVYSATLLWINRRLLPGPLRMTPVRTVIMVWSVAFFGSFAIWAAWNALTELF